MKKAFTLAEVLITLGIIGIVSAMTLPGLIQRQQEKATVSQLQKIYSTLQQALMMAIQEHGTIDNWCRPQSSEDYTACANSIQEKLTPYLKKIKRCEIGWHRNCFALTYANRFNSTAVGVGSGSLTYIMPDGISIGFSGHNGDGFADAWCTSKDGSSQAYQGTCGTIYIDLNGQKKPNRDGDDFFAFKLYQTVIRPLGSSYDSVWVDSFDQQCLGKNSSHHIGTCAAWVIYNGNMDYLRCADKLGWDKAKSCKTTQ